MSIIQKVSFQQRLFLEREMKIDSQTTLLLGVDPESFTSCIIFVDLKNGTVKLSLAEMEIVSEELHSYLETGKYINEYARSGVHLRGVGVDLQFHSLKRGDNEVILNNEALEEIHFIRNLIIEEMRFHDCEAVKQHVTDLIDRMDEIKAEDVMHFLFVERCNSYETICSGDNITPLNEFRSLYCKVAVMKDLFEKESTFVKIPHLCKGIYKRG